MKAEDIYDAVTDISDDMVEDAKRQPLRRRRRFWFGAIAAVLAVAMVAGCFLRPSSPAVDAYAISEAVYPEMAQYPNDMIDDYGMPSSDDFDAAYDAWWDSLRAQSRPDLDASSLDGYFKSGTAQFLAGAGSENRTFSPVNVYMALAMLAELTDGESRAQILSLLGSENIESLRAQANDIWNALYRDDGTAKSVLASSLWLADDVEFNADTLNTLAENYYASSYRGEMGSDEFNAALQDWLNEQTGGLLSEQVGSVKLSPETVMALATTVDFQSKWDAEFDPDATETGTFHAPGGDVDAEFMHTGRDGSYYWAENFSAAHISLANGGRMWFILPDEGVSVDELLSGGEYMGMVLDPDGWEDQKYITVNYAVPKFDISSSFDLGDGLKALGITDVFDAAVSDFSPMTDMDGVYLSQARHGVRVAIDEEGVTAVAFTVLAAAGSAAPPDDEVDFTLDRPFIFVVTNENCLPLFTGVVNTP